MTTIGRTNAKIAVTAFAAVDHPEPIECLHSFTGRMRPEWIDVVYEAHIDDDGWEITATVVGPSVRRDGRDGKATVRDVWTDDADEKFIHLAPRWVRDFVALHMPGAPSLVVLR